MSFCPHVILSAYHSFRISFRPHVEETFFSSRNEQNLKCRAEEIIRDDAIFTAAAIFLREIDNLSLDMFRFETEEP